MRTSDGNDALAWVDERGNAVTQSQLAILRAADCSSDTPALPRQPNHHELVAKPQSSLPRRSNRLAGNLGRPSGARFKIYERLKSYADRARGTLWDVPELARVIDDIYRYPLRDTAVQTLNRQFKSGISDEALAQLAIDLREDGQPLPHSR